MKDVRQCSISSVAFTLEVDAYDTLYTYVESIRARYATNPDGDEILADIEARIAELILSVHSADRVVAKPLVDNIIGQLGSVDEICPDEPTPTEEGDDSADEPNPTEEPKAKGKKGLYRNIDDAPIGGVCSGIAAYVGCSAAIVRAIALLLLFFGGASIWVYIILWIVMPAAVTARQKLEMRGEPITVASIKEYYDSLTGDSEERRSFVASVFAVIGRIFMVIFKVLMVFLLVVLILALLGIVIGLFAVIVTGASMFDNWSEFATSTMALVSVAMLLGLGIYTSMQLISSRSVKPRAIWITLIIWFLLTVAMASIAAINRTSIKNSLLDITCGGNHTTTITTSRDNDDEAPNTTHKERMERLEELEAQYNGKE